jgi:predicted PurR-regulated permease PerM
MVGIGICLNTVQEKTSVLLVIAISLAFAWILWPFYGAVLWATVLAIVFAPLYRRLSRSMQRHNLAAFTTLVIIVAIVILPSTLITASLVQEAAGVYGKFQSGELACARDVARRSSGVLTRLPAVSYVLFAVRRWRELAAQLERQGLH